jgi:hypothetical protein
MSRFFDEKATNNKYDGGPSKENSDSPFSLESVCFNREIAIKYQIHEGGETFYFVFPKEKRSEMLCLLGSFPDKGLKGTDFDLSDAHKIAEEIRKILPAIDQQK